MHPSPQQDLRPSPANVSEYIANYGGGATLGPTRFGRFVICLALLLATSLATRADLTFFGWSDQHVQTNGDGKHLEAAIEAMNALPGRAYPASIGGKVAKPDFVLGLGDITEWPTRAARDTYQRLTTQQLKVPTFDILGNHDSGGLEPNDTMAKWLIARHGSLSYTFVRGGIRFVMVHSEFDAKGEPAQPITPAALQYIRAELAKAPKQPTVVGMHLCLDSITNREALADALGAGNVILVLGGHYHKANVMTYRGIPFVQLPSPEPRSEREVTVLRIGADRVVAIPFDYRAGQWVTDTHKMLDVKLPATR